MELIKCLFDYSHLYVHVSSNALLPHSHVESKNNYVHVLGFSPINQSIELRMFHAGNRSAEMQIRVLATSQDISLESINDSLTSSWLNHVNKREGGTYPLAKFSSDHSIQALPYSILIQEDWLSIAWKQWSHGQFHIMSMTATHVPYNDTLFYHQSFTHFILNRINLSHSSSNPWSAMLIAPSLLPLITSCHDATCTSLP